MATIHADGKDTGQRADSLLESVRLWALIFLALLASGLGASDASSRNIKAEDG